MNLDLGDFLPEGMKKPRAKQLLKVSLGEFLEPAPPPKGFEDEETFSDPLGIEIHLSQTICRCGQEFISPEAILVRVMAKKRHQIGSHYWYKDVGEILLPIAAQRSPQLAKIPHITRTRQCHVPLCHMCMDRVELYNDGTLEGHSEWLVKRPKVLSEPWKKWQLEVNPSREKLQELIANIEARERFKDADEKIAKPKLCDPETEGET